MHSRRPAVVARKAGDVILRGFWGKGVSMPTFEKFLQKIRGLQHGSLRRLDLSDNGLNGNFVPGIIEILRRGARQLDLSENALESTAMQQLCNALPQIAQHLEVLDLRFNPCASEPEFIFCLAGMLPEMKFLDCLSVTVRCSKSKCEEESRAPGSRLTSYVARPSTTQSHLSSSAASMERSRRAGTPQRGRASTPGALLVRGRMPSSDRSSWRVRSLSQSRIGSQSSPRSGAAAGDSAVMAGGAPLSADAVAIAFFRAVAESTQLRILDLRSSLLSEKAIQRLAQFVRSDQLTALSVADCFLGKDSEILFDAVSVCHKLVFLNLRLNAITGHAGIELCAALDASVSLTEVDLASNELGDDFGQAFAHVLEYNEVLWKVDLVRNPLGVATGEALLRALRLRNSTLVSIGDTVDGLFGLGLQTRYQIQCHLDANRKGLELGSDRAAADLMDPGLADFEWHILQDEPPVFEPLVFLQ
mmetsp:Transcript_8814/g.16682  ORF Transcript_8814/g.16682 Transcript_8814/m.16682 type:complete len:474 (+) Transcript_8814:261-1682(+)